VQHLRLNHEPNRNRHSATPLIQVRYLWGRRVKQREDDQQQIGPARVRQSASMRLSQAGVLVPVVLHHLMWRRTLSVIKQYVESTVRGETFGPSPEAAFTSTLAIAKGDALTAVR
jgi:hypothetical protein